MIQFSFDCLVPKDSERRWYGVPNRLVQIRGALDLDEGGRVVAVHKEPNPGIQAADAQNTRATQQVLDTYLLDFLDQPIAIDGLPFAVGMGRSVLVALDDV